MTPEDLDRLDKLRETNDRMVEHALELKDRERAEAPTLGVDGQPARHLIAINVKISPELTAAVYVTPHGVVEFRSMGAGLPEPGPLLCSLPGPTLAELARRARNKLDEERRARIG